MTKEIISELNDKLIAKENEKLTLEQKIKNNQKLLATINQEFEEDLNKLKDIQEEEQSLRKEVYLKQKEFLHDSLSLDSMKKILGGAGPLFSKLKASTLNKAKELKEFIDGSSINKEWVEQRYNEYKKICIQKGQQIQSKEEFQRIALSVKNVKGEIQELNLYDIINKLSVDAGQATKSVKKIIKDIKIQEKVEQVGTIIRQNREAISDETENKFEIFSEWASHKSVNLKDSTDNLYNNYLEYLSKKYSDRDIVVISYSKKSGSFTKALNKFKKFK